MAVRPWCVLALALAAWWGAVAPAGAAPEIGIGENNDGLFTDPLFPPLGIKYVRVVVAYDVVAAAAPGDNELDRVTRYLAGAAAGGQEPLVTFEHARGDAHACERDVSLHQCWLPSDAEYERSFAA